MSDRWSIAFGEQLQDAGRDKGLVEKLSTGLFQETQNTPPVKHWGDPHIKEEEPLNLLEPQESSSAFVPKAMDLFSKPGLPHEAADASDGDPTLDVEFDFSP